MILTFFWGDAVFLPANNTSLMAASLTNIPSTKWSVATIDVVPNLGYPAFEADQYRCQFKPVLKCQDVPWFGQIPTGNLTWLRKITSYNGFTNPWPRIDPALINSCPPHWGLADQLAMLIDQVPSSEYKPQCSGTHWYTQYLVPKVEAFILFTIIPVTRRTSQNQSTRSLLVAN